MRTWLGLLPLALLGLAACREVPGSCSNDERLLCVQVELGAAVAEPEALSIRAETETGEMIAERPLPGVAPAFAARRQYVVEIDVSKVASAARISVFFTARKAGNIFALGTGVRSRGDRVRPLVVTLQRIAADADLRMDPGDMKGMGAADLKPDWPSGLAAEFTLSTGTAGALKNPTDVCYSGSRLYVSDTGNHRVLVWPSVATGVAPTVAVGQPDLTSTTAPTAAMISAARMNSPRGLWCDNSFLLVADSGHSRVLFFDTPPGTGAAASGVVGQMNATLGTANRGGVIAGNTLSNPRGVFWDGARLFIADRNNNRVVIYNAPNRTALNSLSGANAVAVLGQAGLSTGGSSSGASGLSGPEGVYSSGSRVAVAEVDNNRVTVFPIPAGLTVAADAALGQANLANTNPRFGADGLSGPSVVRVFLGTSAYVADRLSSRVLIYDDALPATGTFAPPAIAVTGQQNFNDVMTGTGAAQLSRPGGAALVPNVAGAMLVVADEGNNRVQVFRRPN